LYKICNLDHLSYYHNRYFNKYKYNQKLHDVLEDHTNGILLLNSNIFNKYNGISYK